MVGCCPGRKDIASYWNKLSKRILMWFFCCDYDVGGSAGRATTTTDTSRDQKNGKFTCVPISATPSLPSSLVFGAVVCVRVAFHKLRVIRPVPFHGGDNFSGIAIGTKCPPRICPMPVWSLFFSSLSWVDNFILIYFRLGANSVFQIARSLAHMIFRTAAIFKMCFFFRFCTAADKRAEKRFRNERMNDSVGDSV